MKKRILISALDTVLDVKKWLNDNITVLHLTKNNYVKQYEYLTEPQWAANYSKYLTSGIPSSISDVDMVKELLPHRSTIGIPIVEGAKEGITEIIRMGIRPILLIPGSLGNQLRVTCDINGIVLPISLYPDIKAKYCILEPMHAVIESSLKTANAIANQKIKCIILDFPWNKGKSNVPRAKDWTDIVKWVQQIID